MNEKRKQNNRITRKSDGKKNDERNVLLPVICKRKKNSKIHVHDSVLYERVCVVRDISLRVDSFLCELLLLLILSLIQSSV
jgi:hypothetical protein